MRFLFSNFIVVSHSVILISKKNYPIAILTVNYKNIFYIFG